MNATFKYIQDKFTTFKDLDASKISKIKLDDFINIGLADLFSGKEVSAKFAPELSESAFKARMSAITDINEIVKIGLDNGISIDSITKVLKDKNFNEKEISLAVYNAISKDIKLDESNVENAIELLDEIEDNKRKAERASSKRKADLEQKISEAETELDKIQEEAKIVKVINDNFDKIKKDLKEQGLLNVKC
jgi:DNA-binding transcriptional MerR regulator